MAGPQAKMVRLPRPRGAVFTVTASSPYYTTGPFSLLLSTCNFILWLWHNIVFWRCRVNLHNYLDVFKGDEKNITDFCSSQWLLFPNAHNEWRTIV